MSQRLYEALQQLYDSEINFMVSTFWDGGFDVKLGDQMNGFKASSNQDSWSEAICWLANEAQTHYPNSAFVDWWKANHPSLENTPL